MIIHNEFFKLVKIEDDEKPSALEYIKYRGLIEHINMAKYISSFTIDRKPTYKEIASAFRYDKRLRRILYIYIGLLEEYYRSFICNNFNSTKEIGIDSEKTLFNYCNSSLFSKIVDIIWSLSSQMKCELFENKNHLKKNLDALVKLRNVISHNITLLNYRDFKQVTLPNGETSSSLLANIKNLAFILPNSISDSFVLKINEAARLGEKKRNNQVEWNLPSFIVLKL